ncbi:MAG: RDD family protein [Rickettsiales bacterium]|nr:RDD family protein [Rickettsiales bacterium]
MIPSIETQRFLYFSKRFVAFVLDLAVCLFIGVLLKATLDVNGKTWVFAVIPFYHWVMLQSRLHTTLGKKALGLTVVNKHGCALNGSEAIIYTICGLMVPFSAGLAIAVILLRTDKRAAHDAIANVFVIAE